MTNRKQLVDRLIAMERDGEVGAIATIVKVTGSHYQRAGARMLFDANGGQVGMLSSGCFDLHERARQTMETRATAVHRYDTNLPGDLLLGSGSGCQGVVDILLAPVNDGHQPPLHECLQPPVSQNRPAVIATVVGPPGLDGSSVCIGARLLIIKDSKTKGNLPKYALQKKVEHDAQQILGTEHTAVHVYTYDGEEVQILLEGLPPVKRLVLFGAGYDAHPLVRIAYEVGLHVTVIDHRHGYANAQQIPDADAVVQADDTRNAVRIADPCPNTACISITHDYLRDVTILKELATTKACYVGVVGPRNRAESLIIDANWPDSERGRLYCPAGLDIGANTPHEIALSVVAEIKSVMAARNGCNLRERVGPIHERTR